MHKARKRDDRLTKRKQVDKKKWLLIQRYHGRGSKNAAETTVSCHRYYTGVKPRIVRVVQNDKARYEVYIKKTDVGQSRKKLKDADKWWLNRGYLSG